MTKIQANTDKEEFEKILKNTIEMEEKTLEEAKEKEKGNVEGIEKTIQTNRDLLEILKETTDEEFDYYRKYTLMMQEKNLPLTKEGASEAINKFREMKRRKHEMVDIPEPRVHIGLTKKDIDYLYSEPLQERNTEKNYDSKVVDSDSADYSERKFTEGELKCLNSAKEVVKPEIDERKSRKPHETEEEKEKKVKIQDEENRLSSEKYKIRKLHTVKSVDDFKDLYSINQPFMGYFYLCTIPEYFNVEENEVIEVFVNRETQQIGMTIRESVGKYQVINFVNRLNEDNKKQGFFSKLFGKKQEKRKEEIIVRHLASNGAIEYTEVYSGLVLKGFCEDALSYSNNSYRTLNATFEYEKVTFYKKFDFGEMYGTFDASDIEKKLKSYSEEKLNEIIENSEIEQNVELAKKELERREEEMKKKADKFKSINKQVDDLTRPSVFTDVPLPNIPEILMSYEEYKMNKLTEEGLKDILDGTAEEKDNKEDVQE